MRESHGCLWIIFGIVLTWGILVYLIVRPPGLEDIPWLVAGVAVWIILKIYGRGKPN